MDENTDRGRYRGEHRRHLKDTRGHRKSKHKTQDMLQSRGNQIQDTTRQNQTQEHNKHESTVMTVMCPTLENNYIKQSPLSQFLKSILDLDVR